jgi:L-fuconolactonase
MPVIDSQVHIWAADRPDRPWIEGGASYAHRGPTGVLSGDELLGEMAAVGVDRALLISPTWEGTRNDLVLEESEKHPDQFKTIVRFAIDQPDAEQLAAWGADSRILGTRLVFLRHSADWLEDGTADWVWPVLESIGMPAMVYAPGQTAAVRRLAEKYPSLRLTLSHLNLSPELRDDAIRPGVAETLELADLPNVSVMASSLPCFTTQQYPFTNVHEAIQRVVGAYGAERVFWGSDLSRIPCSYPDAVNLFTKELDFLSPEQLRLVMGDALGEWFGWTD